MTLKKLGEHREINLFADDTSFFVVAKNYNELEQLANQAMLELNEWLNKNRLTLNTKKTHYLDFSNKKDKKITIQINNENIDQVNETKYLGLTIQDNLKWNKHNIQNTINKLNRQIPLYYALKDNLPQKHLNIVYKSLSFSIINYGIELYGKNGSKWMSQLQKTQNRLLKIIFNKSRLHRTNDLHKTLKILKVVDHAKIRLALIGHRFTQDKSNYTYRNLELVHNIHNRNLRNFLNIKTTAESYRRENKVTEQASIEWNNINTDTKIVKSRGKFKTSLEINILNTYQ